MCVCECERECLSTHTHINFLVHIHFKCLLPVQQFLLCSSQVRGCECPCLGNRDLRELKIFVDGLFGEAVLSSWCMNVCEKGGKREMACVCVCLCVFVCVYACLCVFVCVFVREFDFRRWNFVGAGLSSVC